MSQLTAMNRRLLWKETRQVMPLAISLIAAAIVLAVWFSYLIGRIDLDAFQAMAFMPPILFSLGVATVLVSQEKETRSLNWLTSLPVPPRYLIRHQFLFGLSGVAVLWIGCLVVHLITQSINGHGFIDESTRLITFFIVLNSIYLLVCSFTVAWISRAPILGLLSVLPMAVFPYIVGYGIHQALKWLRNTPVYIDTDPTLGLMFSMLLLGIVGVGTFGYRAALSQLNGVVNKPPSARRESWTRTLKMAATATQDYFRGDSRLKTLPPSSTGSLLWQFRNQNRAVVFGLYAAFFACFPIAWRALKTQFSFYDDNALFSATCVVIACSSLCWMALLTFHGDHIQNRVRFLAEQGVHPTRVWITRHLVPLVFLIVYTAMWGVSLNWQAPDWNNSSRLRNDDLEMNTSQFLVGCGILYAISQWLSQLIRPAAIAALVAPFASMLATSFAMFAMAQLGAPIVVVVLALVILPLTATWWMMARWMDGRRGWTYWLTHTGFVSVALLLPCLSLITWYFFGAPGFTASERSRMKDELHEIRMQPPPQWVMDIYSDQMKPYDQIEDTGAQLFARNYQVDLIAKRRKLLSVLSSAVAQPDVAINVSESQIIQWTTIATMLRMQLDMPEDDTEARDTTLQQYRDYLRALAQLVPAMRRSHWLPNQEFADKLEIWLLAEIAKPEARSLLDEVTFAEVVRQVSRSDERWDARRRALLASLNELLDLKWYEAPPEQIGSYRIRQQAQTNGRLIGLLKDRRRTERLIKVLLDYIDNAKSGHGDFPRDELIELTGLSAAFYGVGPAGPYLRIDDVSKVGGIVWDYHESLASQWGAGWEQTGREWANKLRESSSGENAK